MFGGTDKCDVNWTADGDFMLVVSGNGAGKFNSYIYFNVNNIVIGKHAASDETISDKIFVKKGDNVHIQIYFSSINYGLYKVPLI